MVMFGVWQIHDVPGLDRLNLSFFTLKLTLCSLHLVIEKLGSSFGLFLSDSQVFLNKHRGEYIGNLCHFRSSFSRKCNTKCAHSRSAGTHQVHSDGTLHHPYELLL